MSAPIPIVIDTDIGSDPDDALALCLALASPEVDVHGVTIVSGDVDLRARMAARLLGMAGREDIPVFKGQGPPIGASSVDVAPELTGLEGRGLLDQPYDGPEATIEQHAAIDWLVEESRRRPFHLVAIGPLTNVALAMERDAGFAERLLSLTIMGGLLDPRTMPIAWQRDIEERGGAGVAGLQHHLRSGGRSPGRSVRDSDHLGASRCHDAGAATAAPARSVASGSAAHRRAGTNDRQLARGLVPGCLA